MSIFFDLNDAAPHETIAKTDVFFAAQRRAPNDFIYCLKNTKIRN